MLFPNKRIDFFKLIISLRENVLRSIPSGVQDSFSLSSMSPCFTLQFRPVLISNPLKLHENIHLTIFKYYSLPFFQKSSSLLGPKEAPIDLKPMMLFHLQNQNFFLLKCYSARKYNCILVNKGIFVVSSSKKTYVI